MTVILNFAGVSYTPKDCLQDSPDFKESQDYFARLAVYKPGGRLAVFVQSLAVLTLVVFDES